MLKRFCSSVAIIAILACPYTVSGHNYDKPHSGSSNNSLQAKIVPRVYSPVHKLTRAYLINILPNKAFNIAFLGNRWFSFQLHKTRYLAHIDFNNNISFSRMR